MYARAEVEEGRVRAGARVRRMRKVRREADMVEVDATEWSAIDEVGAGSEEVSV